MLFLRIHDAVCTVRGEPKLTEKLHYNGNHEYLSHKENRGKTKQYFIGTSKYKLCSLLL